MNQETLEKTIILATQAHNGQVDKGGLAYILHPLRVMNKMGYDGTLEQLILGVGHDVVEDSDWTIEELRATGFYTPELLTAWDAITRRKEEQYSDYLIRVKANPLALRVKQADLEDNLDITRPGFSYTLKGRYIRANDFLYGNSKRY